MVLIFLGIILAFLHSVYFGALTILAPVVVFLYSYEFRSNTASIKKIPYTKDLIIAGGWAALLLVVLIYNNLSIDYIAILFSIGVIGKFFVMAVLYDFKDITLDLKNGIIGIAGEQEGKAEGNIRGTYGKRKPIPGKARPFLGLSRSELNIIEAGFIREQDE